MREEETLKEEKDSEERGVCVWGEGLHFYRFQMFRVIPLGYGHYTETNPPI